MSNWCWYFASQLFEDLSRRGLCTASAIERAYKKDDDLMWRLYACAARCGKLIKILWELVRQTVTYSEYYRPFFKRYVVSLRLASLLEYCALTCIQSADGKIHIDKDRNHWRTHGLQTELDCLILEIMSNPNAAKVAFYDAFSQLLVSQSFYTTI